MDAPSPAEAAGRLRAAVPEPLRERALTRADLLVASLALVALDRFAAGVGGLAGGPGASPGALVTLAIGAVVACAAAYLRANPATVYGGRAVHPVDYAVLAAAFALVVIGRLVAAPALAG